MRLIKITGGPGTANVKIEDENGEDLTTLCRAITLHMVGGKLIEAEVTMFAQVDIEAVVLDEGEQPPVCTVCQAPATTTVCRMGSGRREFRCNDHPITLPGE